MHISRKSEYAIHSLMILALHPDAEVSVDELAQMQQISRTYLAKVMQRLAQADLVQSNKGYRGGYTLKTSPQEITLAQVVSIFEDRDQFYQCLNKERACKWEAKCIINHTFSNAFQSMITELEKTRLSDLLLKMTGLNKNLHCS